MKRLTFIVLIAAVTFLTYVTYQQEDHISDYKEYIELLKESHEIEVIRIKAEFISNGYVTMHGAVRNVNTTFKSPHFTITQDTVIYTGGMDTTISIGNYYKYYRVQIEGNPNNLRHIQITATHDIHAEYGDTVLNSQLCKYRRVKNGDEQYSFDGINWFEL